jgi:hypothetical protein
VSDDYSPNHTAGSNPQPVPSCRRFDVVGDRAWYTDVRGQLWRVGDAWQGERSRVYRVPPDPEATHRVYLRVVDGLQAVCDLPMTRRVLAYHGVGDGAISALSIGLEHALNRTPKARERLAL